MGRKTNKTENIQPIAGNELIIKEFEKLVDQIKYEIDHAPTRSESMRNYYRLRQITKALDIIKKYPKPIKSGEELSNIKGIGEGTISRINEILKKGRLSEIKTEKKHQKYLKYIEDLTQVYGIGPRAAYEFVTVYNIKSVEELINAYNKGEVELSDQMIIGLKYHGVYKEKIPREEIDKIDNFLAEVVLSIDPELFHIICGSYRRKKLTSNDIDVLITHPNIKTKLQLSISPQNYLVLLVKKLKELGFLLDSLTDRDYEIKYMGFCQFQQNGEIYPVRRIDIRYIPNESYYTSICHMTGSGEFNRKMRMIAIELGYQLTEYGLFLRDGKKLKKIPINSEQEIFEYLGMEYVPPEKRD